MQVRVDPAACAGHGICEALAPHIFELGADGLARVLVDELGEDDLTDAENAVGQCPEQALHLLR